MSVLDIKTIRIGGMDFEVRVNPGLSISENACGKISVNLSRIEVEPSMSQQRQSQTMLHEIVHGIIITSKLNDVLENDDDEERLVDGLAYGLLQVVRDNPDLIREIQSLWEK